MQGNENRKLNMQKLLAPAALVILYVFFSIFGKNFFGYEGLKQILQSSYYIGFMAFGVTFVIITGGIDLSIGTVMMCSAIIGGTAFTNWGWPVPLALVLVLIAGLFFGFCNGVMIAKAKLPPFIATLGTMQVARGVAQMVNNNMNTNSIGDFAKEFRDFFYYEKMLGIYNTFWIAVVVWLIFNFILSQTRTGRHLYAIGSNIEAAKLSGVSVFWTTTKAYLVSAVCAGLVGLIQCATTGTGTMDSGLSYEMYAVAASVIGGVSTLGGQGILLGTVVGAGVWSVLSNGLQFAGVAVGPRNVIIGVIVVLSVLADVVARSGRFSRKPKS